MIIPIRCVTCNKVLADKWKQFQKLVEESTEGRENTISIHVKDYSVPSKELIALKKLGIDRYCCRRHMITHIDLINDI